MRIQVDTAVDVRGEPAPSSMRFDGRNVGVADVVDQWWGADDRYFKVKDAANNTYILRLDQPRGAWELVMFLSKRGGELPGLLAKLTQLKVPHAGDGRI
jgi:hypothetical protein